MLNEEQLAKLQQEMDKFVAEENEKKQMEVGAEGFDDIPTAEVVDFSEDEEVNTKEQIEDAEVMLNEKLKEIEEEKLSLLEKVKPKNKPSETVDEPKEIEQEELMIQQDTNINNCFIPGLNDLYTVDNIVLTANKRISFDQMINVSKELIATGLCTVIFNFNSVPIKVTKNGFETQEDYVEQLKNQYFEAIVAKESLFIQK